VAGVVARPREKEAHAWGLWWVRTP
jgi:hypothetical protein